MIPRRAVRAALWLRFPAVAAWGLLACACHGVAQSPASAGAGAQGSNTPVSAPKKAGGSRGPSMEHDPQIVTTLLQLLESKDKTRPAESDFTDTTLKDILTLGTPAGFHLRNRYIHLGVSLAQALSVTDDPRLKSQLIELARWERSEEIRAIALIALATRKEPEHGGIFREALDNPSAEVRFAALEALELWNLPPAKDLFLRTVRQDFSPVIRIYAGQALFRRGDPKGLAVLRAELDSGDWLARGMAARYLGDLGTGEDYDRLLNRMTLEQNNDFVLAECAIGALKLFPKKKP
ncbi:MAG: HEAT repeat domain-containing protein [Elusimicrobia bacterium]|nr:HEAT repeat domain-containing protein [Elusimicrobiota bacterium]